MTINIGYILGHFCEFLLFIYFADTSFYPRKKYITSNLISLCGYILLFGIGIWGRAYISILLFFVINIALLKYCYNIKLKSAIFYSLILDMISTIGEYIVLYILGISISKITAMTSSQSMAVTIGGKLIYLTGVLVLKRFANKKIMHDNESQIILAIIPLLTIICLTLMMKIEMDNSLFSAICGMFLIMNFITFISMKGLMIKTGK